MRLASRLAWFWVGCCVVAFGCPADASAALPYGLTARPAVSEAAGDPENRVGRMTDAEARAALIDELARQERLTGEAGAASGGFLDRLETDFTRVCSRLIVLGKNLRNLPADLAGALTRLTGGRPPWHLLWMALIVLPFFAVGFAVERGAGRWFRSLLPAVAPAADDAPAGVGKRAAEGLLFVLPQLFGLFLFALTAALLFLLVFGESRPHLRLFILTVLLAVVVTRLAAIASQLVLAPGNPARRLVPLSDAAAGGLHRWIAGLAALYALLMSGVDLLRLGQMPIDSLRTVAMGMGTVLLLVLAWWIGSNRREVADAIRGEDTPPGSLKDRFAASWHAFALAYLFLIWLFGLLIFAVWEQKVRGALPMSLLIVPLYLALDRLGLWLVDALVESFRQPSPIPKPKSPLEKKGGESTEPDEEAPQENPYVVLVRKGVRLTVFLTVAFWFLEIWGVGFAFSGAVAGAILNVFLTVLIAYLVWVWGSRAIDRRILKSIRDAEPDDPEKEEDEWGGAAAQDRFYTLLPLFRKSLAVFLVVMAVLISLSAMGINIGPLLAGAGVVGLAIGFGAQRLVRDILSGIFFLLDDTFRIGEYVECGSVSGTVEELTLRLVKLRHHRGMLQFVPYGDIQQVTNMMRGGIVVKFNLEFPYDTDIDKVRKIIKKVGQAMLLDEELGPDFIRPLKSQGVREIGDSIMTIRAKFTARPGAHFVIRREAYRRITEALAAKGIHYASRKFIVDIPKELLGGAGSPGTPAAAPAAAESPGGGAPGGGGKD
jgi:small-conductance mechanosensitive channel